MGELKRQTSASLAWSIIDKFGFQTVAFLVGVVTMRLISPDDFGIIAALAIFTLLSNILVESGFTVAMVRRTSNTNDEYTAAFYFNIAISVLFYVVLMLAAPLIEGYYDKINFPDHLAQFLFLAILINSFGIIPNIILVKSLKFKYISIANLSSAIISGVVVVVLAIKGYTCWALAWQQVLQVVVRTAIMWFFSRWKPSLKPCFSVIKELFSFSAILIATSIISTGVKSLYTFLIGKKYNETDLGYYGQANKFHQIPGNIVSGSLSGVAYPILSILNLEKERQLIYFRKIMRITAFLIFPMMFGLIGVAENFILVCTNVVWLPAVPYLQILSISAMFMPFQNLCLQILNVMGQPKWNFRLEMIRNSLIIISLIVCVLSINIEFEPQFSIHFFLFKNNFTISVLLVGFSIATFLAYITSIFVIGKFIKYSILEHFKDILPYVVISIFMYLIICGLTFLNLNMYLEFILQVVTGIIFYFTATWLLGSRILKDTIELLKSRN
ncbi:MAG: lipopolysaccharide biosynthesis protein [Prevotellaceae bacterium]|jgi:O-antigen/teichoic acid export membrane protein|nr:lipopolysaccharide biosynthesis protein [Prevotellaceae bacterium]